MTCIVGLVNNNRVYMGADSASVSVADLVCRPTKLHKMFRRGPFLIGYTTSFRMGQLLEHWLEVPEQNSKQPDYEYMVKEFIEAVRSLFKEKGFSNIESNVESGGVFLVGYHNKLYTVYSDFQINIAADEFDSVGCGSKFALGAMAVLLNRRPEKRIKKALEIAAFFSGGVCGPFFVDSLK